MMNAHAPPLKGYMRNALLGVEFTFMDDLVFPYEELHMNGEPWQQFNDSTWFKIEIGASDE